MQHVSGKAARPQGGLGDKGHATCWPNVEGGQQCDYDNASGGWGGFLGFQCMHSKTGGTGESGEGLGNIRKDKSCHSARIESQLNNSSRQLDWLRAIKLMMQGHWKWATPQRLPTPQARYPLAKINTTAAATRIENKRESGRGRKEERESLQEWRSWHSSGLRGGLAWARGARGVVTTKSTAEGPITLVGASASLLTHTHTLTLLHTRPSIY